MKVLLVNLDRSPERLDRMAAVFSSLQIPFERFSAFDCGLHKNIELPYFRQASRRMIAGEYGTMRSHLEIYKQLARSDANYYVIFEDDIVASPFLADFLRLLRSHEQIFEVFDLIRLETYVQDVVVDASLQYEIGPITFMKLLSTNFGTAGYVVPRRIANRLVEIYTREPMPIDHMFSKHNMERLRLTVGQALPAIVVQDDRAEAFGVPSSGLAKTFQRTFPEASGRRVTSTRFRRNLENEARKIKRLIGKMLHPSTLIHHAVHSRRMKAEFYKGA